MDHRRTGPTERLVAADRRIAKAKALIVRQEILVARLAAAGGNVATGREVLEARHEWQRARELSFYTELPEAERELAPDLLLRLASLIDELAGGPSA